MTMKLLAATGMLGSGFREESVLEATRNGAAMIGCDAGTTDFGPHLLATGKSHFSHAAVRRDLDVMLRAGRSAGIPVVIGSAGGSGSDESLDWTRQIVNEIAAEHGLRFRLALIHAEQTHETVLDLLREGRVEPMPPATALDGATIRDSLHVVAMMGVEPIQQALAGGAEVILAGRVTDAAIFAALPLMHGYPPAVSWHAGKILECGAAAVAQRAAPDSMMASLDREGFEVEPLRADYRCTPQSVASHALYENVDPFRLTEPSGTLDTRMADYVAASDRSVRVTGSRFEAAPGYTVKLEASRLAGYSTVVIGGVRDPLILRQLPDWLARLSANLNDRLRQTIGDSEPYRIMTRIYGQNGVMGALEPNTAPGGHEVLLVWEVLSASQELSHSVAASLSHMAVHNPIPEWHGLISGVAFPFAPSELDRGPVYEFSMNHRVRVDSPLQLFPTEMLDV
jgi:Acyclic terpene utilisation family protein AtuA